MSLQYVLFSSSNSWERQAFKFDPSVSNTIYSYLYFSASGIEVFSLSLQLMINFFEDFTLLMFGIPPTLIFFRYVSHLLNLSKIVSSFWFFYFPVPDPNYNNLRPNEIFPKSFFLPYYTWIIYSSFCFYFYFYFYFCFCF